VGDELARPFRDPRRLISLSGTVPRATRTPRKFGNVSIVSRSILCRPVPNPNITIRKFNLCIAVYGYAPRGHAHDVAERRDARVDDALERDGVHEARPQHGLLQRLVTRALAVPLRPAQRERERVRLRERERE
jgi:hypothetical protein